MLKPLTDEVIDNHKYSTTQVKSTRFVIAQIRVRGILRPGEVGTFTYLCRSGEVFVVWHHIQYLQGTFGWLVYVNWNILVFPSQVLFSSVGSGFNFVAGRYTFPQSWTSSDVWVLSDKVQSPRSQTKKRYLTRGHNIDLATPSFRPHFNNEICLTPISTLLLRLIYWTKFATSDFIQTGSLR